MFTGLIEEIGTVRQASGGASAQLIIAARTVLQGMRAGDSIAVNGVCLTLTAMTEHSFTVDIMPETLRRSNLGQLRPGSPVNLERAVMPTGRLGGHIVQGHVDGVGRIAQKRHEHNATWVTIEAPATIMHYVVIRAFIAVDGASLTVARVERDRFDVSLIPHTQAHITLPQQPIGAAVNLEVDIIAKYVEHLLQGGKDVHGESKSLDWESLAQYGF